MRARGATFLSVRNGSSIAAAALLAFVCVVGCSSDNTAHKPSPGTLPAGTAELSVNGGTPQVTNAVQCQSIEWMRTISTGDADAGVTVMLSNAKKLVAEFVRFRNFDSFTGSYDRHLQGEAAVAMTGPTYRITGTTVGFAGAKATERTTRPFELRVSC
jgi:ipoprotein LpqH